MAMAYDGYCPDRTATGVTSVPLEKFRRDQRMGTSDRTRLDERWNKRLISSANGHQKKAEADSLPTAALCVRVRRRPRDRG